jgi:hypothetical protein
MYRIAAQWLLGTGMVLACTAGIRAAEPIRAEDFGKIQALVKPSTGDDKWSQIPWLTNLWEARQRAAAQGKPILLWEMDGNPLGCV